MSDVGERVKMAALSDILGKLQVCKYLLIAVLPKRFIALHLF